MADNVQVAATASPAASPVKVKKSTSKKGEGGKPKKLPTHPPVNEMVVAALKALKERNGSSLQAIKKYISANFMCDVGKLAPFLKKALKTGVEKEKFTQTKGTGASGRFKLILDAKKEKKPTGEKKRAEKPKVVKKSSGDKATKKKKPKTTTTKTSGEKKAKATAAKTAKERKTPKQKSTKPSSVTAAKKSRAPKPPKKAKTAAVPAKKASSSTEK